MMPAQQANFKRNLDSFPNQKRYRPALCRGRMRACLHCKAEPEASPDYPAGPQMQSGRLGFRHRFDNSMNPLPLLEAGDAPFAMFPDTGRMAVISRAGSRAALVASARMLLPDSALGTGLEPVSPSPAF